MPFFVSSFVSSIFWTKKIIQYYWNPWNLYVINLELNYDDVQLNCLLQWNNEYIKMKLDHMVSNS